MALPPLGWTWRPWGSIKPRISWAVVALSIRIGVKTCILWINAAMRREEEYQMGILFTHSSIAWLNLFIFVCCLCSINVSVKCFLRYFYYARPQEIKTYYLITLASLIMHALWILKYNQAYWTVLKNVLKSKIDKRGMRPDNKRL